MTRSNLRRLIGDACHHYPVPPGFEIEISRPGGTGNPVRGEFTTNLPLRLASNFQATAEQIGQTLRGEMGARWPGRIELCAGRLNFFMSDQQFRESLERAVREGTYYGAGDAQSGQRILVEFVSSDPTGPLAFSAGRHAAVGEALCRLLENQGARVAREFYLNDATTSSKIRLLGESVAAWVAEAFGRPALHPEGTQSDAFVRGIAADLARREGHKLLLLSAEERLAICSQAALEAAVASQKATLEKFGVRFDEWTSEAGLRRSGRVEACLHSFQERGIAVEREGALWLLTSRFGDEADRVLRRANGAYTYLASDIAYHAWKAERGFDRIINLWTAEHGPYVERTRAALRAAELPVERFEFLLCEGANLKRDGVPLRLGLHGGPLALEEELGEIDADGLKFLFVLRDLKRVAEVDLEIAHRDDESNRAYAARLLPSRLARLLREAEAVVPQLEPAQGSAGAPVSHATWAPGEAELARLVALWPDEAESSAAGNDASRIARFVLDMSAAVRELIKLYGPVSDLGGASPADRIQLLRASHTVASNALRLLGMEARERF